MLQKSYSNIISVIIEQCCFISVLCLFTHSHHHVDPRLFWIMERLRALYVPLTSIHTNESDRKSKVQVRLWVADSLKISL